MTDIKPFLKSIGPIYRLHQIFEAKQVERRIFSELDYYRKMADQRGISYSESEVKSLLRKKLRDRNIKIDLKDNLHVVYVSCPTNWEPHNIPPQLEKFGQVTTYYWKERGFDDRAPDWLETRHRMDSDLLQFVKDVHAEEPIDVLVCYVAGWRFAPETIEAIGELGIFTCNFYWDDKLWFRGDMAGGRWRGPAALASAFDVNLTNAESSCIKYLVEGGLALFWPEGANPDFHRVYDIPFEYDVTFIGQKYGYRPVFINYLRKKGIKIATFGPGWDNGELPAEGMVELYSKSRINLGFGWISDSRKTQCLKGRDFEVPMSGGLYLTTYSSELECCYEIGKEIVCYRDKQDCAGKIKYLLDHPEEAESIRKAGAQRALREHSWRTRFEYVFRMASEN